MCIFIINYDGTKNQGFKESKTIIHFSDSVNLQRSALFLV